MLDEYEEWWPEGGFTIEIEKRENDYCANWLQGGIGSYGKSRTDAIRALADTLVRVDDWVETELHMPRDHSFPEESLTPKEKNEI